MCYNPLEKKKFDENYLIKKVIFAQSLSPSVISLAECNLTKKLVAVKELKKEKFHNKEYLHDFAKNELLIHHSLWKKSKNIVEVYDYFEDENSYVLLMEYCENATYFEDILENVNIFFYFFRNIALYLMKRL